MCGEVGKYHGSHVPQELTNYEINPPTSSIPRRVKLLYNYHD